MSVIERCPKCDALEGRYHELNCNIEVCPFCGDILVNCLCRYKTLGLYDRVRWGETDGIEPRAYRAYKNGLSEVQEQIWLRTLAKKGRIPFVAYKKLCTKCGSVLDDGRGVYHIGPEQSPLCETCYITIQKHIEAQSSFNKAWVDGVLETPNRVLSVLSDIEALVLGSNPDELTDKLVQYVLGRGNE